MTSEPNTAAGGAPIPHPLLRAADIRAGLTPSTHEYNQKATIQRAPISDMVGIKEGFGVAYATLPPNGESTTIHYHLLESEWIYVTRGSGKLQLVDASLPTYTRHGPREAVHPGSEVSNPNLEVEEIDIGPGDFAGFPAGVYASKYAHGLVAGPEGMEYLMGGTRAPVEVCSYPLVNKTIIFDDPAGVTAAVPPSTDPVPPKTDGV